MEKEMDKEQSSIMLMINIIELNMKELLKMIFLMDLEKYFITMEVVIKEYFNLVVDPNLVIIYIPVETNNLDFRKKINLKDFD